MGIAVGEHRENFHHAFLIDRAQHQHHFVGVDATGAVGNRLIEQAQGVAHTAASGLRDEPERTLFKGNRFGGQDRGQMLREQTARHARQIELQAARQDSHRQLFRIGGGEQKFDVRRWFFQGLQQGVERMVGEHVHFVDQIDLVARMARCVLDVVQQFAGLVDLGARGRIDFDQIDHAPLIDFKAGAAHTARPTRYALFTVERLGQHPRQRSLAHPARAGEEIGVMQAATVQRVDQGLEHVRLPDHFGKVARPPLACKDLIAHVALLITKTGRARRWCGRSLTAAAKAANVPATPRRPQRPLPLLPSGPDGVYGTAPRGDRHVRH